MKNKLKSGKFTVGVVIITVSYFLGVPVLVAACSFWGAGKRFIGGCCFLIYGFSWLLLGLGIFLAGKEGYIFVKAKISKTLNNIKKFIDFRKKDI